MGNSGFHPEKEVSAPAAQSFFQANFLKRDGRIQAIRKENPAATLFKVELDECVEALSKLPDDGRFPYLPCTPYNKRLVFGIVFPLFRPSRIIRVNDRSPSFVTESR